MRKIIGGDELQAQAIKVAALYNEFADAAGIAATAGFCDDVLTNDIAETNLTTIFEQNHINNMETCEHART